MGSFCGWAGLADGPDDGFAAYYEGGGAAVIADGDVLVVGEERLVGAEELAGARGVMDGGVEVGVVGDVNWLVEGRAGDGMEGGFGLFSLFGFYVGVQEGREGFAEESPGFGALGHEQVEGWGLTGFGERWGEEA